jgi:hypothetical protein
MWKMYPERSAPLVWCLQPKSWPASWRRKMLVFDWRVRTRHRTSQSQGLYLIISRRPHVSKLLVSWGCFMNPKWGITWLRPMLGHCWDPRYCIVEGQWLWLIQCEVVQNWKKKNDKNIEENLLRNRKNLVQNQVDSIAYSTSSCCPNDILRSKNRDPKSWHSKKYGKWCRKLSDEPLDVVVSYRTMGLVFIHSIPFFIGQVHHFDAEVPLATFIKLDLIEW